MESCTEVICNLIDKGWTDDAICEVTGYKKDFVGLVRKKKEEIEK